ncbi:response regulator transcription factor [Clostridium senegalense]|uniref:response regulator transcription factor n=1 Tax=Clostridium senegalense TaxID=1465809 RepID=UPI000288D145|nr:response regulator transcription factor [Clostridium senegalense]MBU5227195.1 response regulator transcription factor [Clostridium senegalense]
MEDISINNKKILLVDDEVEILKLLSTVLKKEGLNHVFTAETGSKALEVFKRELPDLVILDIMLPDMEGYEVCKKMREKAMVPILFLSAKNEELDRILGFAIGADDYITKPFSPKEVAYRVKAHLRRSVYVENINKEENVIKFGPFVLDEEKFELRKNGEIVELKAKEFKLLAYLANNKNQIISKENICDRVWGEDYIGFDNTIMVHMRRLREKIEENPSKPQYLVTAKGLGYKLVVKDE